jgi:NADH-quinone oxidoreductase subunit J
MILQIFFIVIAAVTLVSAIFVVTARRLMHSALWLVLSLFGVAVLFAFLEASFFAVVQVLVYIGAIAILIIFAVMLTRHVMDDKGPQLNKGWWVAAVAAVGLFAGLVAALGSWAGFQEGPGAAPDPALLTQFGLDLVDPNKFAIPFEVASILLLAALVGAIYIAADKKGGKE